MIYNHGINDMPYGWISKNELNKKIYKTWSHMLERCYSERLHKIRPTYIGCTVCDRWLKLSNFVKDVKHIDGYNEELFLNGKLSLDKDIKSDNKNKTYCLYECMFVSISDNVRQSIKHNKNFCGNENRKNNKKNNLTGNHTKAKRVAQYNKDMELIKIWNCIRDVERELKIANGHITYCCQGKRKSAGGFIWRYVD